MCSIYSQSTKSWVEGLGNGKFGAHTIIFHYFNRTPPLMLLADINNDGAPDIVLKSGYFLRWYKNVNGIFTLAENIAEPFGTYAQVADIDNDGDLDIFLF